MHGLSKRLALLTVIGAMGVTSAGLAAPPPGGPGGPGVDCRDPANARNPICLNLKHRPGPGMQNGMQNNAPLHTSPPPMNNNTPMGMPNWNFSTHDRDQFHQRFRSFNFGFFPAPGFSIRLGIAVPHNYQLRPVPRSIYRYYPQFRGYLYFVGRNGNFVIVNPRTYRIVAIL